MARTEIFNDELTEFVPSYDGRNKEPVTLPCKLPLLLMLGTEGIAVGMSCKILPHNFPELLEAQIAILKKQPFKLLPDFLTGGLMDAREYADGKGSVKVRAKIKAKDDSTVVIKEIPPTTTTDSLIGSIEDAAHKGKIKVRSINDFTSEEVEIEIKAPQGVSAEQLIDALYAFTDCETSIASRIIVIKDNRPVEMTVSEVLRENTAQLVADLKRELELREKQARGRTALQDAGAHFHREPHLQKNRAVQNQRGGVEAVARRVQAVSQAVAPRPGRTRTSRCCWACASAGFRCSTSTSIARRWTRSRPTWRRRRKHLKNLTKYAIARLEALLEKYGPLYPRLTKSSRYDEVDAKEVAFKAFKVAYDRESGYVGYKVSGEEFRLDCTKFDKLLMVFKDGHYKVTELPEKLFVGPDLVYCGIAGARPRVHAGLHESRRHVSEAVHFWRHDHEQGIFLHSGEVANSIL